MGDALSRLGWRLAAPLYALLDRAYRRWHRLERVGGIFHVGLEPWRGAARRLEDGTEVAPGDAVLHLHFDSQMAADEGAGGGSAAGRGLRFARRFTHACQALARRLREDPQWADVVAVHGVSWISAYVAERWGFESARLVDGPRTRFLRWHMGNLLAAAGRPGWRRGRQRPWPMECWISRRRLCERYGEAVAR